MLLLALSCLLLLCIPSHPQQAPAPGSLQDSTSNGESAHPEQLLTLHAYSNLIQMPVLILSPGREPLPPIKPERFSISLDAGPLYHPTHVRVEGADPISLSLLIDLDGLAPDLTKRLDEAIANLAPNGLTTHDHVSIYAMDCTFLQTLDDAPADPGVLLAGAGRVLTGWTMRRAQKHRPPCTETVHLWDALATLATRLAPLPGRRVILALTDGNDRGSKYAWRDVAAYMQRNAIAAIGLRPQDDASIAGRSYTSRF